MKENLIDHHWQDFLVSPLAIVDRLYNQMNGESSVDEFHSFIKEQLTTLLKSDASRIQQIPYLNNRNVNYDNIRNKSLVRYRCMVQDMFNPEIYAAILSSPTGKKINLYTDSVLCDEKYFVNPNKNQINDRYIYYVISIPGVNEWVRQAWDREGRVENVSNHQASQSPFKEQPSSAHQSSTSESHIKRHLDDEPCSSKKKKVNESNAAQAEPTVCSKTKDYCTPIKAEENLNRPIIVKVYDTKDLDVRLNDMIEIIGVIEFPNFENRSVAKPTADAKQSIDMKDPEISSMLNNLDLDHEDYVYSELPRIHALHVQQLTSISPSQATDGREQRSTYSKLINLFDKVFFGDKLAAQYFVCWLVSRVYKIQDSLPIGNFPINISNLNKIPNDEHALFIEKLYELLACLCTHSLNLPVTIGELNNRVLNPYKDKDNTKLQSGLLQLPSNFRLILDETTLQPGSLKEMGIKNLSTLKELIAWQSIEYDHLFYTQKINTDINVLVFSEGKSLFDMQCEIKLKPVDSYTNIEEQFNLINLCLNENLKEELRAYLSHVRTLNCDIPAELQKKIQDDFVQMRRDSSSKKGPKICSDDLHRFLSLSRLLAVSECSHTLSDHHWERAKLMELERRTRTN